VSQIVLMVPRQENLTEAAIKSAVLQAQKAEDAATVFTTLPWVPGECELDDFKFMMMATNVTWSTEVESALSTDGRRTVHMPRVSAVTITRKVDLGSGRLTKAALQTKVSTSPWEIYFLRSIGGADTSAPDQRGVMQVKFMTMKLYNALITKCSFSAGDGDAEETLEVSPVAIEWIYHRTSDGQDILGKKVVKYNVQTGTYA